MDDSGHRLIPYESSDPSSLGRSRGRGVFWYALGILAIPGTLLIWGLIGETLPKGTIASPAAQFVFGWTVVLLWLLLVATIPASLVGLAWWAVIFFRRPRLGWDRLTLALLLFMAYYGLAAYMIYRFAMSLPPGSSFH